MLINDNNPAGDYREASRCIFSSLKAQYELLFPLAIKNRKFGLGLNSVLLNLRVRHFLDVAHFE